MLINDIDFAIRFWIENEDGKEIADKVFSDLYEMNEYIKATWADDAFEGVTASFSPVEIINGEPEEAVTFVFEIYPYMELEEDEIQEYLESITEAYSESNRITDRGNETRLIPLKESDNFIDKKVFLKEIVYVCPHCFRELEDCRCEHYPYFLVQIDRLILPVIKTLNQKGYITTSCCGGHANSTYCCSIYIAFENEHNFEDNLPEGSYYSKSARTLNFKLQKDVTVDEFLPFQKECLEKLARWAEELPTCDN